MHRAELLTKFIASGENRSAAALLDKLCDENSCCEYAAALIKILLVETAKRLNDSIAGFYCDAEKLAKELFSDNPPPADSVIASMCKGVREAGRENHKLIFRKALRYLEQNMCDNQLSVGSAAEYAGISKSGLVKLFTENAGVTPGDYLSKLRTEKSLQYLEADLPVTRAASNVGFSSSESYIRAFKKHMGTTPGAWKRNKLFL